MTWQELKVDNDYEILDTYIDQIHSYPIRKKNNKRQIRVWRESNGYYRIKLNRRLYLVHRVIAEQFIPNPKNFKQVDHINNDRGDNRLENLRFVTSAYNNRNKSNQVFVDDIPGESICVVSYGNHQLEDLYFYENVFYSWNGINYLVKKTYLTKRGIYATNYIDVEGKRFTLLYTKFKREYGLID